MQMLEGRRGWIGWRKGGGGGGDVEVVCEREKALACQGKGGLLLPLLLLLHLTALGREPRPRDDVTEAGTLRCLRLRDSLQHPTMSQQTTRQHGHLKIQVDWLWSSGS
jgi:hypothetical protein